MLPGIRNADGGDASSVFTRLLRVFSRRRSEPPRRVCKPRIYGPSTLEDEDVTLGFPDGTDQFEMRSELLARIQICYQRVKIRDAAGGGFCFGLLDPLSNIIANTFIDMAVVETEEEVKEEEDDDASTWHGQTDEIPGDMNQRSLNGLITFLAVLFPHLSDAQAVWYLHKAEAHPLVAARIIIKHRRMDQSFGFGSDATAAAVEAALCCAAAAARHPNPKRFLTGWRLLSPSMKKLAAVLSPSGGPSVVTSSELLASFPAMEPPHPSAGFDLRGSWELATSRLLSLSPDLGRVVFPGRTTMRRMLLTTIHGYYLQALARLPRDQLCSQSQHLLYSMLHYGHSFGPLDPVSNIVFNTIWYSSACPQPLPPPKENAEMDAMVSTSALLRIAVRSFYGLVSFLCTRYDTLTVDQAMHDLLVAGADLRIADPNFHGNHAAAGRCPSASIQEAYAAAAAAALHPKPETQCVLLLRQSALILRMGSIYLNGGGPLSCEVAYRLSSTAQHLSSSYFQAQLMPETMVLDRLTYARVNQQRKNFWNQHARVVRMVKSAMDMYNSQPGVPKYELHVICGVNEKVHGPEYITGNSQRYQHSHINFLATCKDSQSAGALPVLFFAQWSNDGSKDECFCCPAGVPPLNSEQIRCFYCEYEGSRIVHPANESFHGRYIEFGKMLGGGLYAGNYTNNYIIEQSCSLAFWVGELEDDSIYSISSIADDDKEDRLPPVSFHRLIRLT